jgi:hypothetical protein
MRKFVLRLFVLAGLVVALGACGDSPTRANQPHDLATGAMPPLNDVTAQGCASYQDGVCTLDPVTPAPSEPIECDPYASLDWCGDDGDCLSSGSGTDGPDYQGTAACGEPREPDGSKPPPSSTPKPCPDYGCPPPCDPTVDPACEKPLTSADSATIKNALASMLRPASQFSDTTAARVCGEIAGLFRNALAGGFVFRGGYDSNGTTDRQPEHYGAFDPATRHIHYDPAGLDAANGGNATAIREVAITALHEGAHWGGFTHPAGATFDASGRDYYTDPPFNHLNPGPNSCIPR